MKNSAFLLLFVMSIVFTSCKEDDPEPLAAETQGVLLAGEKGSSKSWKLVSATYQLNAGSAQSVAIDACQLDDIFKFTNNDAQAYEMRGGSLKCAETDDDLLESGTWAFTLDGKMVVVLSNRFSFSGLFGLFAVPSEVVSLTDTTLKLKMVLISGSDSETLVFDFTKS